MVTILFIAAIVAFLFVVFLAMWDFQRTAFEAYPKIDFRRGLRFATPTTGKRQTLTFEPPPEGVFLATNHVWVQPEPSGNLRVGLDRLLISSLGGLDRVYPLTVDTRVRPKDMLVTLRQGRRVLGIRSPVQGVVVDVNPELEEAPERLVNDPYNDGWIYRIAPERMSFSLRKMTVDYDAIKFTKAETTRFAVLLGDLAGSSDADASSFNDGEPAAISWIEKIDNREWVQLLSKFFGRGVEPRRGDPNGSDDPVDL